MENPFLEQGKLYAHMLVTSLAGKCGFVGIAASVSLESELEATVYKAGVVPPHQVVPVVQHGQLLKGVVTLVAPPFGKVPPHASSAPCRPSPPLLASRQLCTASATAVSAASPRRLRTTPSSRHPPWQVPSFGGLTVRLHVARLLKHGGAAKHSKEQAEALKSMPAWMQPKDTAIVRAGRSNHASRTPTCGRNLGHPSLQPHAHSLQPHAPSVRTACTDPATAGTPSPPQPCGRCAGRCMRSMRRCT